MRIPFNQLVAPVAPAVAVAALIASSLGNASSAAVPTLSQPFMRGSLALHGLHDARAFHPERSVVFAKVDPARFHQVPAGRSWRRDAGSKPDAGIKDEKVVYVTDAGADVVDIYNNAGTQIGQLTGFNEPQGIAVDLQGNLYVADTNNQQVEEFAPGGTSPIAIYSDPDGYPVSVDVSDAGTIGVTNICSAPSCGQGGIVYFTSGSPMVQHDTPSGTCDVSAYLFRVYFAGFDSQGNYYADGTNASGNMEVVECYAGSSTAVLSPLIFAESEPGGVLIHLLDGYANVTDQENNLTTRWKLPANGKKKAKKEKSVDYDGTGDAVQPNPDYGNHWITVPDAANAVVNVYKYPGGGAITSQITGFSQPIGVAVFPRGDQ